MLIYSCKLYSGLRASFGWLIYVPWFSQKPSPDKSPRFAELSHRKNNSIRKSGIFRDPSTRTVTQIRNIPGAARQGLKFPPQNRPFLTILPYYSLCKMAIFATFQNRVIFHIFDVLLAVSFMEHLLCVSRVIFRTIFCLKISAPK